MGGGDKKRKKGYYQKCAKGCKKARYQPVLSSGMRGFLITCSNRAEKEAAQDAYKILNEYADELYGPEFKEEEGEQSCESEEDIEKALQKEVSDIKSKKKMTRRFQAVDAGANGCIFIKTTLENPEELLYRIVTDLHKTKVSKSRFIMKIFPVLLTCRAEREKIKSAAKEYFADAFKGLKMFTYEIVIKVRHNTGLSRTSLLPLVNDVFVELGLPGKVQFGTADYVISIDVLKSVCCISLMKEFHAYKRYNLHEIAMGEKSNISDQKAGGKHSDTKGNSSGDSTKTKNPREILPGKPGTDIGSKDTKQEVKHEPLDPFMSKIAGLIQTKVTETPVVKREDKSELGMTTPVEEECGKEEGKDVDQKPAKLSLSCPYVASSI